MMKSNNDWVSKASIVFTTMFFVFCIISIVETRSSMRVSEHGLESIAPENLKRAPESFRLNLLVESRDFPADEMAKTEAWKNLQARVDAFADRLETTQVESRRRTSWISIAYLCSAIGMAVFSIFNMKRSKSGIFNKERTSYKPKSEST